MAVGGTLTSSANPPCMARTANALLRSAVRKVGGVAARVETTHCSKKTLSEALVAMSQRMAAGSSTMVSLDAIAEFASRATAATLQMTNRDGGGINVC